jgi:hypothetical protein
MEIFMTISIKKWTGFVIALLALTVASPKPASAQFFSTVWDPGNYAVLVKTLTQDGANYAKLVEQVQTATKIYQNGMQIYNLGMQEASFLKNKQFLQAAGYFAQHASIPGHSDWDHAMTSAGSMVSAAGAFQSMTLPGFSMQYRISLMDSFGPAMLQAIGSCTAAAQQTDQATSALEGMAIDNNPAANTRANQANVNNLGLSQSLRIQECQHNMQLQQSKLQLVQAMAQRDQDQRISEMRAADAATRKQLNVSDTAADIQNVIDR